MAYNQRVAGSQVTFYGEMGDLLWGKTASQVTFYGEMGDLLWGKTASQVTFYGELVACAAMSGKASRYAKTPGLSQFSGDLLWGNGCLAVFPA